MGGFTPSRDRFDAVVAWLEGQDAAGLSHSELETRLEADARELFRQLTQDHLDLRAVREPRVEGVIDATGVARGNAVAGHRRGLATVFGGVQVTRIAYRRRGQANLHPCACRKRHPPCSGAVPDIMNFGRESTALVSPDDR